MNIWLKTQNARNKKLFQSLTGSSVASVNSMRSPLPIILQNQRNDEIKSNSNISIQMQSQSQQSNREIFQYDAQYADNQYYRDGGRQVKYQNRNNYAQNEEQIGGRGNMSYNQQMQVRKGQLSRQMTNYEDINMGRQQHYEIYKDRQIRSGQQQKFHYHKNHQTNLQPPLYTSLVAQTFSSSEDNSKQKYKSSSSSSKSLSKYRFSKQKISQSLQNANKNNIIVPHKSSMVANQKDQIHKFVKNKSESDKNYSILRGFSSSEQAKQRAAQIDAQQYHKLSSSSQFSNRIKVDKYEQILTRDNKNFQTSYQKQANINERYQNVSKNTGRQIQSNNQISLYNRLNQKPIQRNRQNYKSQIILNNKANIYNKQKQINRQPKNHPNKQNNNLKGGSMIFNNNYRQFEADRQVRPLKLAIFSSSNSTNKNNLRTPGISNNSGSSNIKRQSSSDNQQQLKINIPNKQIKVKDSKRPQSKQKLKYGPNPASNWRSSFKSFNSLHMQSSQKNANLVNSNYSHMNSKRNSIHAQSSNKQIAHHTNSKRLLTTNRHYDRRQYIISIIQYCSNQVGIACYHIKTGEIKLTQIIERMTYIKTISTLQRFYPQQIIFSSTLQDTLLMKKLISIFRRTSFRPIKRTLFDQTKGYYIYTLRGNKNQHNPDHKFLAYAALHALLTTMQSTFDFTLTYSALNIKWHYLQEVLVIDSQTISDLQIFINKQTKIIKNTFIDNFKCLTDGGMRMLRANILQPLTDINSIKERFDLVQILLKNENKGILDMMIRQLIKLKNYEPITAKFIQNPKCDNIRSVKSYLNGILVLSRMCFQLQNLQKKIGSILQNGNLFTGQSSSNKQSTIINSLYSKLKDKRLSQIRKAIQDNFDPEVLKNYENTTNTLPHQLPPQQQKKFKTINTSANTHKNKRDNFIFLFKLEKIADQFAEISRLTYSHTIQDILKIFQQIKQKCPSQLQLKLLYNQHRGYYLSCKASQSNPLDLSHLSNLIQDDIIFINSKNNTTTFSTSILISLNNRLKQNQHKLIYQSTQLLLSIIKQIQQNMQILFEVNYWISMVDMIIGFVMFVKNYQSTHNVNFCRPKFTDPAAKDTLKIQKLRTIWTMQKFHKLSSDISLNLASGTSALIIHKQINSFDQLNILYSIGFLTILAQIGCLVPASQYSTPIYDTLISKMQVTGNLQNKLSHFQTQLLSLRNILQNARMRQLSNNTAQQRDKQYKRQRRGRCLVLIDQICKGTKPQQQYALSLAAVDQLSDINKNAKKNSMHGENIAIILVSDGMLFKMLGQFDSVSLCEFGVGDDQNEYNQKQGLKNKQKQLLQCVRKYNFHPNFQKIYSNLPNFGLQ